MPAVAKAMAGEGGEGGCRTYSTKSLSVEGFRRFDCYRSLKSLALKRTIIRILEL